MRNRRNFYRILQVQPDAPIEVIKASYRTLMGKLKQHPDLGGAHWNATVMNEAYQTLSDTKKRAEYDRSLFLERSKEDISRSKMRDLTTCPFCKSPTPIQHGSTSQRWCSICKSPLPTNRKRENIQAYKRAVARTTRQGHLVYYASWPGKGYTGRIKDLSPNGMRFFCSERVNRNSIIKIKSPILKATARVTSCQRGKDGSEYTVGVAFISVEFENTRGSFLSVSV